MNEHHSEAPKNNTLLTGVAVFAVIAVLSLGAVMMQRKDAAKIDVAPPAQTQVLQTATPVVTPVAQAGVYKNGEYTVVGNYVSPGGPEEMDVKLTLANDKITSVVVTPKATLPASKNFQEKFSKEVSQLVVGKNISEVKLDKVSGSSLTPKGFNDALQKVMTQAQS